MKLHKKIAVIAVALAYLVTAVFEWLPSSLDFLLPVIIGPGIVGFLAAMLMTPGGVHGDVGPRMWSVGVLVNGIIFYTAILTGRWIVSKVRE